MSPTETAQELGVHRYTVHQLIKRGQLPEIRIMGNRLAIPMSVVQEFKLNYKPKGPRLKPRKTLQEGKN